MAGALTLLLLSIVGDTEARFDVDPFTTASDVVRFTFEEDEDLDVDGLPDDWTRRRGPGFPAYVRCLVDNTHGRKSRQSLRVAINGGRLTYYSPFNNQFGRIDPAYDYVFRGFIRTEQLQHNAAVFSVSFLNARRQRLKRYVSKPVTGTHRDWQRLEIGPIEPPPKSQFVVIGCHVVHGERQDIRGDVWFDDLWLGKLPRLRLVSDARAHYLTPNKPIRINAEVSGLETGVPFQLRMSLSDVANEILEESAWPLQTNTGNPTAGVGQPIPVRWNLPARPHGYYFLTAHLERDGRLILVTETSIAVVDPAVPQSNGEFGWSLPHGLSRLPVDELAHVAGEAGINWLKLPLWKSIHGETNADPTDIAHLLEKLADRSISPIGMLDEPPTELRSQFASEWAGISEVFVLPPQFWMPSLEPVIARYGSSVGHWQLGKDQDFSFAGLDELSARISTVKQEFNRIGRRSTIGVQWPWPVTAPIPTDIRDFVVTLSDSESSNSDWISDAIGNSDRHTTRRWVLLKQNGNEPEAEARAVQMIRQMIAACLSGADGIFMGDIFDTERGLVRSDGAPNALFLPWRTAALSLRGARHLGSFQLPDAPINHVFARGDEAIVIFTSDTKRQAEVALGDRARVLDIWGRPQTIERKGDKHVVTFSRSPVFCVGCSEPLARWRLEVGFEKGRMASEYGGHEDAIVGRNTFREQVTGQVTLKLPRDWEAEPASWTIDLAPGESFRLPTTITLPENASLGKAEAVVSFNVTTSRRHRFEVLRAFEIGLGDVIVDVFDRPIADGRLEIEQIVINRTQPLEVLDFKCNLSVGGHKSQTQYVTRLGKGRDRKVYYLPSAEALRGHELWLNLKQVGGRRNLNKRLIIGEKWSQAEETFSR